MGSHSRLNLSIEGIGNTNDQTEELQQLIDNDNDSNTPIRFKTIRKATFERSNRTTKLRKIANQELFLEDSEKFISFPFVSEEDLLKIIILVLTIIYIIK